MDAFFDQPLTEISGSMSLRPDVRAALVDREGALGVVLSLVEDIQRGDLDGIDWSLLSEYQFSPDLVNDLYLEVLQWQRQVSSELEF